jgi:hypothetical protein
MKRNLAMLNMYEFQCDVKTTTVPVRFYPTNVRFILMPAARDEENGHIHCMIFGRNMISALG